MARILLLLGLLGCFASCTNPPYKGSDVLGADEFVMDSYKIREGKFSILQMQGKAYGELSSELLCDYKDVIYEGDILDIAIYHPSRQDLVNAVQEIGKSVGFRVLEGNILLPDLPLVKVEGSTLEEARQKIQAEYSSQIKDVTVFIGYQDRIERKVELSGLVHAATVPVDGRMRLFETLAIAKVPAEANFFKSYVVRDNDLLPVDLFKLVKEGDMSQNIVMRGGDKVYVAEPSASFK